VGTFDTVLIKLVVDLGSGGASDATAYALLVHSVLVVPVVVLAMFLLWRADLSLAHVIGRTIRVRPRAHTVLNQTSTTNERSLAPGV
jgi:hypothetical protein